MKKDKPLSSNLNSAPEIFITINNDVLPIIVESHISVRRWRWYWGLSATETSFNRKKILKISHRTKMGNMS